MILKPEPVVIEDERVKALMFEMILRSPPFAFDKLLTKWFKGNERVLARFLTWLDAMGLEIRGKQNGRARNNKPTA